MRRRDALGKICHPLVWTRRTRGQSAERAVAPQTPNTLQGWPYDFKPVQNGTCALCARPSTTQHGMHITHLMKVLENWRDSPPIFLTMGKELTNLLSVFDRFSHPSVCQHSRPKVSSLSRTDCTLAGYVICGQDSSSRNSRIRGSSIALLSVLLVQGPRRDFLAEVSYAPLPPLSQDSA